MLVKQTKSGITTKMLYSFIDDMAAEVTLVEREDKNIICFSTMIGCPIGCKFCYSGVVDKYIRKLTTTEMQVLVHIAYEQITNRDNPTIFSAMGEGEPSLNIPALQELFDSIVRSYQPNWKNKFAISTVAPSFSTLLDTLDLVRRYNNMKLQYSLHTADLEDRRTNMRGAKLDPLTALNQIRDSGVKAEINITLIDGFNNKYEVDEKLAALLEATKKKWKIKLNVYNPIDISDLQTADLVDYIYFENVFEMMGHEVEFYCTDGNDIDAACGQLHYQNLTA